MSSLTLISDPDDQSPYAFARRLPLRKALDIFIKRAHQLERHIAKHGWTCPPVPDEDCEIYRSLMQPTSLPQGRTVPFPSEQIPRLLEEFQALGQSPTPAFTPYDGNFEGVEATGIDHLDRGEGEAPAAELQESTNGSLSTTELAYLSDVPDLRGSTDLQNLSLDWMDLMFGPAEFASAYQNYHLDSSLQNVGGHENDVQGTSGSLSICNEEEEDLIAQLSNRMGHLHLKEDGESRVYGATSNFNLAKRRPPVDLIMRRSVMSQPLPAEHAALSDGDIDPSLELCMERLYFAWQGSTFHLIDRTMYEQCKALWRGDKTPSAFYSPLLTTVMYLLCQPDPPSAPYMLIRI